MTTPPPPENAIDDLPERAPWRTVTRWLLVVNIAVYLIDVLLRREAAYFVQGQQVIHPMRPLAFYGHFSYFLTVIENQWWRLATYQFVHGGIGHLFANMMGLLLVGPVVEERFGRRRFLRFYLICGAAGPAAHLLLCYYGVLNLNLFTPLVGASASIYGVMVAAAMIAPRAMVELLLPPIDVKLRTLVIFLVGLSLMAVALHWSNAGGHAAHLGGVLIGWLLMRHYTSGLAAGTRPASAQHAQL